MIVGQEKVIDELLIAILANGHVLLIGVPGLAKTLLVSTLSQVLDLKFSRIQFTPDLMPSDITGTEILEEDKSSGKRQLRFVKGPVFANIVLADEINRTPPKTQAALLQAMQEHEVTAGGQTFTLEEPFFVLATQNPIEQEGTYPLPEAQLDRFMFNILIDYPTYEEENQIVKTTTALQEDTLGVRTQGRGNLRTSKAGSQGAGFRSCYRLRRTSGTGHPSERQQQPRLCQELGQLGCRTACLAVFDSGR